MRYKKKFASKEEWLPIISEDGKIIGQSPRSELHKGRKILHPVVHLHVIGPSKKILLQKRPMNKLVQPGKWDTAVGGHISAGETLESALDRETYEETGLSGLIPKHIKTYRWETEIEAELVYMFMAKTTNNPSVQSDEVEELRFWSKPEIEKQMGSGIFTPNFIHEFRILVSEKVI
jgi:isopentenyldiphosphate isomerase